jgi:hypothetical protein
MPWSIFTQGGGTAVAADWAQQLLKALGAPVSVGNEQFIYDWEQSEGGGGKYNPLNQGPVPGHPELTTTGQQYGGGAADFASWAAGLTGAVDYINMPAYSGVKAGLMANNPIAARNALWASSWAGSHYGYGSAWNDDPFPGQVASVLPNIVSGGPSSSSNQSQTGGSTAVPAATGAILDSSVWSGLWKDTGGKIFHAVGGAVGGAEKLYTSATALISMALNGGTWIRLGETVLGTIFMFAGMAVIVVVLASSPGGLTAIGSLAALIPGEGEAAGIGADLAKGAKAAGARPAPAAAGVQAARSSAAARQARGAAAANQAAAAARAARERRAAAAQAADDDDRYEASRGTGRANQAGYRARMRQETPFDNPPARTERPRRRPPHRSTDTSDLRRRTP